jgi:hypothetical protein
MHHAAIDLLVPASGSALSTQVAVSISFSNGERVKVVFLIGLCGEHRVQERAIRQSNQPGERANDLSRNDACA